MEKTYQPLYRNSFALCIGIDNYLNLGKLETCVAGAKEVASLLALQNYKVMGIYNSKATASSIRKALAEFAESSAEDDRVFIYFAGHGMRRKNVSNEEVGYLGLYDTGKNYSKALYFQDIIREFQFIKAKHIFLALDACFSGLALARQGDTMSVPSDDIGTIAQNLTRKRAIEILTAGGARDFVYDRLPYGETNLSPFTYFLTQGILGKADWNGIITSYSLAGYVRNNVQLHASGQIPQFGPIPGSSSEGAFVFRFPQSGSDEPRYLKNSIHLDNNAVSRKQEPDLDDTIIQIQSQWNDNWEYIRHFMKLLDQLAESHSESGLLQALGSRDIFSCLGFPMDATEHEAYVSLLHSAYYDIELESCKPRLKLYFRRLKNLLARFPDDKIQLETKNRWQSIVQDILNTMGDEEDAALTLKRVEDFAKSTLALTRFTNTAHDPELMSALYLIKKLDYADHGGSAKVEQFLLQKTKHELEQLIDPSSKNLFTEMLDDESNVWWGILVLLDHSIEDFQIHDYRGISGSIRLMERLIARNKIVYPNHEVARKEVAFEIHNEQKTILWINNLGFLIAQLYDLNKVQGIGDCIRKYVLLLQHPFLYGEKPRVTESLFFRCLELEVWGRILSWNSGIAKDHIGREIKPGEYRKGYRLFRV